jgi:hypothetical protein
MAKLSHEAVRNLLIGGIVLVAILLIAWAAGVPDSVLATVLVVAFVASLVLSLKYGEGDS